VEYWINVLDTVLIFSIFALSLNLLLGYAGQVSVAHAAFGAIGGYTAAYISLHYGVHFLPALAIGTVVAAACGTGVSLPALRLSTEYLILLTIAVSSIVIAIATSVPALGGSYGLLGRHPADLWPLPSGELLNPSQWLGVLIVAAALTYLLCWRLGESPFGRVLRGIREDEVATRSLGKDIFRYKTAVFGITAGMAGLAGALLFYYNQLASPGVYGFSVSLVIFTMVIFGGMGNLAGSVLGALVLVLLQPVLERVIDLAPAQASLTRLVIYGVGLALLMRLRPQGALPEGTSLLGVLRRLAAGRGLRALAEMPPEPEPSDMRVLVLPRTSPSPLAVVGGLEGRRGSVGAVEVRGLSKRFGGIVAVDDLSFELQPGLITALVGPNGAGKTTVFNLLTGVVRPDSGVVLLNGQDVTGKRLDQVTRLGMARSFQDVRVHARLSALENVMLGVQGQPGEDIRSLLLSPWSVRRHEREARERAMDCLAFVGLTDAAAMPAGALAFGQQKLVALARVLATQAEVLLLDEPASGIDVRWVEPMLDLVAEFRAQGKTVCIVEHNLHVVQRLADTVCFMELGRVTARGPIRELMRDERLAEAYFGTP
jgi:branched-chain amino acid transport system permease protein